MDAKKFLELYHRGQTGKKISKEDWDIEYVVETVMELVDDYDLIDWNRSYNEQIIPEDDELFDNIFEAAKKLILEIGMYNLSTQRQISFTTQHSRMP